MQVSIGIGRDVRNEAVATADMLLSSRATTGPPACQSCLPLH